MSIPESIYIVTVIDRQIDPPHVYRISLVVNDSYQKLAEREQDWLKPYIKSISVLGLLTVKWNKSMVLPESITNWTEMLNEEVMTILDHHKLVKRPSLEVSYQADEAHDVVPVMSWSFSHWVDEHTMNI